MGTELAIPEPIMAVFESTDPVDAYTKLVPVKACQDALAYGEVGPPMGTDTAKVQAKILIGSYPAREVNDADIYARAITSVLSEVPPDIGCAAVDRLTRRSKWLPTRAEVCEEIQRVIKERRAIAWRAKQHLAEHERRAREAAYAAKAQKDRVINTSNLLKRMDGDAA